MRLPRVRFTVRRMMVAVAVVATGLAWAIARPYPDPDSVFNVSVQFVEWSDGRVTIADGPKMMSWRGNSWFYMVDWPDGSVSYYLVVR